MTVLLALVLLAWAVPAFAESLTVAWDPSPEPDIAGYKLLIGTESGVYTSTIDVGNVTSWPLTLGPGQYYVAVKAYDTSGSVGGYSTEVTFTVSTGTGPAISSVTGTSGPIGESVTITGGDFGSTQGTSTVTFNGVTATPAEWSATSITVAVPGGATTGDVVVTVSAVASNGVTFTVVPPAAITSLSPTTGAVTASVTITGTGFGPTEKQSTVAFNGIATPPSAWSDTSITVPVPAGAPTGDVNVTVTRGSVTSTGVTFAVVPTASVTSLSPSTGAATASVTITGTNFGSTQGASTVSFNGVTATPTSWSETTIATTVPSAATTGNVTVTVAGVASDAAPFTVVPTASITSLSPSSARVGQTVTISGADFGSTQGASTVTFNGVTATPTSWSAASITVPVPNGAATGTVAVTVGGVASNARPFAVVPVLSSLSPTSGAVGGTVTITGTDFGSTPGASTVTFNGVTATPTSWSATSIVATVPGDATTGNVTVLVGGVASNAVPFTVVPVLSALSPTSGFAGAAVTIAGTGFGSTQGASTVTFNGVTATPTSWSATSILATVPSAATTGNVTVTVAGVAGNGVPFAVLPTASITSLSPTSGVVGRTVTITGANFGTTQGASTVSFNGVTATPTSWSSATIATTVPSGATTGNVTVTVGGAASNGVPFTVVPTASISSLSPPSARVGQTVTISGADFGSTQGAGSVTFNGVAATPATWSATRITVTVPTGATTGNVVVTVGDISSNGAPFTVMDLPTMSVDRAVLNFGAVNAGTSLTFQTPNQTVAIGQSDAQSPVTWTAASNAPWLTVSPASGTGPAALSIGVQHASTLPPAGSASVTGAVTITYSGSATATSTVNARLNLPAAPAPPAGVFDTPAAGATGLQGSIAVTGWAVDDIAVDRVELWRDLQPGETTPPVVSTPSDPRNGKVFIGNATLVNGARPDIETLNPMTPQNTRGGWGYLLLTWGLWNQGNGTYSLYAFAIDAEGQLTTLGKKTIGVANASANKPFGSIDTPAIGGVASGTVTSFGWALTPNPGGTSCRVPSTGVQVSIDSGPLQPVVFGDVRSDVARAFAGFTNGVAAGGHVTLDTTALANGVHTIAWLVTDDCNRAEGVGSRFFTVQNSSVVTAPAVASAGATRAGLRAASADPVVVSRGFGELGVTLHPDDSGRRVITIKQGERIEVRPPNGYDEAWQVVLGERRALPDGATWDQASHTFAWQPAPGFLGEYELVFVRGTETIHVAISVSQSGSPRVAAPTTMYPR